MNRSLLAAPLLALSLLASPTLAQEAAPAKATPEMLGAALEAPLFYLQRRAGNVEMDVRVEQRDGDAWKLAGAGRVLDFEGSDFFLEVELPSGEGGTLRRSLETTEIFLPHKQVVFRGEGEVASENAFVPEEMLLDILDLDARSRMMLPVLMTADPTTLAAGLLALFPVELDGVAQAADGTWTIDAGDARIVVAPGAGIREVTVGDMRVTLDTRMRVEGAELPDLALPEGTRVEAVDRDQMERTLTRGLVRAAEIQHENVAYTPPPDGIAKVPGGTLVIEGGNRLIVLEGDAATVGAAHGQLVAKDIRKLVDSTLYTVGLVYSLGSGKWFPSEIRDAWARLEPHTPKEYLVELDAMADAAGIDREEMRLTNFFPELFHCSGFAIRDTATVDGKLFHGRVLDYMTDIGLQYRAAVIVYNQPGKHAWMNVGYTGFVGSVTGMNAVGISIGEMGGRGEGAWDGMPMAQLVRHGLERASTLDELKTIFTDTPRTCEYYYVFADGNTNDAVGVYAIPERIDFVGFGQAHEKLPRVIPDAILLSAGDRYATLCDRVEGGFGALDAEKAMRLMDRGVAMKRANLHNVLMVPEDGVAWVANAGKNGKIAAEMPYVKYDLHAILREHTGQTAVAAGE